MTMTGITASCTRAGIVAQRARTARCPVVERRTLWRALEFARSLGFDHIWTQERMPPLPWDAVIEASNAPQLPAKALELVEPGGRVVYIGLAGTPSLIHTRALALTDVTAVGVLSASPGLPGTIDASAVVDPRPLVAATVTLEVLPAILAGTRPEGAGPGPKSHVAL